MFHSSKKKYGSDTASVALEAIHRCEKDNIDVLLIDTAGRLQTNTNLMISLQKIIKISVPNVVLFLGEAQCGNDLVHQVTEFQKYISDVRPRGIDFLGITKVDIVQKKHWINSFIELPYTKTYFVSWDWTTVSGHGILFSRKINETCHLRRASPPSPKKFNMQPLHH
jgi:hypothetical protein